MLFRAVAPVSTARKVLRDLGPEQNGYTLTSIFERVLNPGNRDTLSLITSREKWERILIETQATPAKLDTDHYQNYPYYKQDVIWLSDHNGVDEFLGDSEFDIFIHEV